MQFTCCMWFFHVRCSSMQIPKNLTDVSTQFCSILFNGVSFIRTLMLSRSHHLCFGLMTTYLVLLAQNQLYSLFISSFILSNVECRQVSDICIAVQNYRHAAMLECRCVSDIYNCHCRQTSQWHDINIVYLYLYLYALWFWHINLYYFYFFFCCHQGFRTIIL